MSREIKFRAWDKDNKCWFEPEYDASNGRLEELSITLNGRLSLRTMKGMADESTFSERFKLMQYTGLKDKNGVEIYEDDIVAFPGVLGGHGKARVFWSDDSAQFIANGVMPGPAPLEVIGNIYENPELMPNGKDE